MIVCLLLLSSSRVFGIYADPCDSRNWLQQRTSEEMNALPLFCRGTLDARFDHRRSAIRILHKVIRLDPSGAEAYQAHDMLFSLFFRAGQYREALTQIEDMLKSKPNASDVLQERALLLSLTKQADQSGKGKHSILAKSTIQDGNPHIPVRADGKPALWFMDTGANISVMSDTEAASLGLAVHPVDTLMADISGRMTAFKVTQVNKLIIGKTELRHVAFVVVPHTQQPFNTIPTEQQALLGIQVLWALRSIHISATQQIETGLVIGAAVPASPLGFYEAQPVTEMSFEGQELTFTLDTGAIHTTLNPAFARSFPASVASGVRKEHALTGVGGKTMQPSISIEQLRFGLAGKTVLLSPANVLLDKTTEMSGWAVGNLGYDLIKQAAPITIDFRSMRLASH